MRLVAKVLYNNNSTKDINIIDGNLVSIDIFTSKFENEKELKKRLEDFIGKKIIGITIQKVYILDDSDIRLSILYSDYSFFVEPEKRLEVYRRLKYMDLDEIGLYFESMSEYDISFKALYEEFYKKLHNQGNQYYAAFHSAFYKQYQSLRALMINVLPKEIVNELKVKNESLTLYDEQLITKFIRRVILEKTDLKSTEPSKTEMSIFDEDNHDFSSKVNINDYSYADDVISNSDLSLEDKMTELQMIFDNSEDIKRYLYENNKYGDM